MNATYTKLREGWGIRVTGITPTAGQQIQVTTKAGAIKTEQVAKVIWTGDDKYRPGTQVALCAIAPRATQPARSGGYAPGKRCYCAECGEPYRRGKTCWETGGACTPEWE